VAVALTQAQINEDQSSQDFLQQNLDDVYHYKDPRSYPLSSYSYLIVPETGAKNPGPPIFNAGVGRSLSTYINFYLCQGQQVGHLHAEGGLKPGPDRTADYVHGRFG
jgi:hypothetical protein